MNDLGQTIISGISGKTLTKDEKEFLQSENIGGVILFAENYESPAQLAELVNEIQKLRDEYPLFISVDQEGGRVARFREHFSLIPPMQEVAMLDSPKVCYHVVKIMAEELNACGINLNFSPCCDVLTNPNCKVIGDRAFGTDEESVSKMISSVIRGFQANDILSCAKHFPGHGSTSKDSHFDLPYIKKSLEELEKVDIPPFVKATKSRVEFIMMAHLVVDAIDQDLPTSLSPKAYTYLRDKLKFTKIILTDDMEMKAITDKYSTELAAVKALKAGADILIYRSMDEAKKALSSLKEALRVKEILNSELKEKVDRIIDCKRRNLSEYSPIYIPDIEKKINSKPSQIFLSEIKSKIAELKNR